ncbi:tRNA1(Val) A37 N6-methylase TrmN6 [Jannaschia faecimaris]|uniref:tRNA1(Val) A37 N6-methylase TrmN6 n=2 Tax=Jannaschia faecimaris TaxID=1244108 RepID=A0A1H3LV19_9RHOB|nr:tRNA1(Val) A37 N6-methylase TrmN6 [Jannaschia faecimaris]
MGCGVGAAMYCLAGRVPGVHLTDVELEPWVAALARRNGEADVVEGDALCLPPVLRRSFDHVICNSPYFTAGAGRTASRPAREAAMREDGPGGFGKWLDAAARRAGRKGSVTVIARAERLQEMIVSLSPRLGHLVILPITSRAGQEAHRVVVQGIKGRRAPLRLLAPLILHEGAMHDGDRDNHTVAAQQILRDGRAFSLA